MKIENLKYQNLKPILAPYESKGRNESAAYLNWFLENIYRLDDVSADDAICDQPNDKGIDGIYVDDNAEQIHFFQCKIVQSEDKTIGDVELKNLIGSLTQFETKDSVMKIIDGNAHPDLKKILTRSNVANLVEKGYKVIGVFVCNQDGDKNTEEILKHTGNIILYDRKSIISEFVDFDANEGINGNFTFDTSYVSPLKYQVDKDINIYLFPVSALDLIKLDGIEDTTLFSQNVRLSLGNTPVNKAIANSVQEQKEHKYFPLYHNGITLICEKAFEKEGKLNITNYVVVNGAQSISTFFKQNNKLTSDLRVFVKIICLNNDDLAKKITINSNNQNSIKPRDLRSNHDIMIRLKSEFGKEDYGYEFEIKRGEKFESGKPVISNEDAGRLLLAFDAMEPYSCHQIYKVFDEKYAEIFGRPEVNAGRIVFFI